MTIFLNKVSEHLKKIVVHKVWNYAITSLILMNTVVLSLETYSSLMTEYGTILKYIDRLILYLFVVELIIRFCALRLEFFKSPWALFDLAVVMISLVPSQHSFAALRAARALRTLRLISIFPRLRGVIEGLIMAIPGIIAIAAVMSIILLVFGLIASELYGANYPSLFGNIHLSIFTLFQIMTLEGWADIVRDIMKEKEFAWIFFVIYILISTFSVLNLFIAVIVEAMQRNQATDIETEIKIESESLLKTSEGIHQKLDYIIKKMTKP